MKRHCPKCKRIGYLTKHKMPQKKLSKRDYWNIVKKKYPKLDNEEIKQKIHEIYHVWCENIPHKEVIDMRHRKHHDHYWRIDHNVKTKDGWITKQCYIGIDPRRTKFD